MEADYSLQIMSDMLKTGIWICGPILAVCLIVGLLVSVIQVVTQVQEMTLTFVPKLLVAIFFLISLSGWMLSKWMNFSVNLLESISSM